MYQVVDALCNVVSATPAKAAAAVVLQVYISHGLVPKVILCIEGCTFMFLVC